MTRGETTKFLSDLAEKLINPHNDPRIYWAREVTFDYATTRAVRVDYMKFKPVNNTVSGIEKGDFYCYEVKSSVEDFRSKNGHNFIGDYNYYVMPHDVLICPECGTAQALDDALRRSDMPEEEKQAYKAGILKAIYK